MNLKETLINSFNTYNIDNKDNLGMILFISGINDERELIANPEGLNKLEYIKKAYNNDLELISNSKIKITNYQLFDNRNPIDLHINLGRKMVK